MKSSIKENILKTIMVVEVILLALLFPGIFIFSCLVIDQRTLTIIIYSVLFSFVLIGIVFVILLPIFGGIKQKSIKAEKFPSPYNDYNDFINCLSLSLAKIGYREAKSVSITGNGILTVYIMKTKSHDLNCVSIMRFNELTNEDVEQSNAGITDIILQYSGKNIITNPVNMISIFCVDRITPTLRKIVNGNLQQSIKNGRLNVGISFGSKQIYVARQKDGFAILHYKRLRKQLFQIIDIVT